MRTKRVVKSWLFSGPKGTGKTTIAKILALSYQCIHQEKFGHPCLNCRKNRKAFPIYEINCADVTGIDGLRNYLQGSEYGILGPGRRRVYILDECHRLSGNAQDLMLKYLEETPETTVFILCSTKPWRIVETIRSRCIPYQLSDFGPDDIAKLVKKLLDKIGSKLPVDRLSDALVEEQVRSPRNICNAVEKYIAGASPADAALVEGTTAVETKALTRSIVKGDWNTVSNYLLKAENLDMKAVRLQIVKYLRTILLESSEISDRTRVVADAVADLCKIENVEDTIVAAMLGAVLYKVTALFSRYKR